MNIDISQFFLQMVGGNEERFFHEYWRRRTLVVKSALPALVDFYTCSRFLNDYRVTAFDGATLLVSVDQEGKRMMSRLAPGESIDKALLRGISVVVQALLIPETLPGRPREWDWFVNLHRTLCEYLLPGLPCKVHPGGPVAAVDIFCTSSEACSGGHYDSGDVFYFVLQGEKEWVVELTPDFDASIGREQDAKVDLSPHRECMRIELRPGDCLYVPPYTYHRVSSRGDTLAVSLGLPTYSELAILRSFLIRIHKQLQTARPLSLPLPSYPRNKQLLFRAAQHETRTRILAALDILEDHIKQLRDAHIVSAA